MYGRGSHDKLTDCGDWREHIVLTEHRYMLEDTRIGLSFFVSVAGLAGVETPLARGVLAIGGAICGEDFMVTGRTLESLGLGALDRDAIAGAAAGRLLVSARERHRLSRRRPHGARHRGRVRLCRPSRSPSSISSRAPRADFDKLAAEAMARSTRTLASLAKLGLFDDSAVDSDRRARVGRARERGARRARHRPT